MSAVYLRCSKCRATYNVSALEQYGEFYVCPICSGEHRYKTIDRLSRETKETREMWRRRETK